MTCTPPLRPGSAWPRQSRSWPSATAATRRLACVAALCLWGAAAAGTAWAQAVQCHITFAGATRSFTVAPAASFTGAVTPLLEGASFTLAVVNLLPPDPGAGVTVRTYGVFSGAPYLLHQAFYLPDAAPTGPHGFTGLQVVREPLRHREIAYWCARLPNARASR